MNTMDRRVPESADRLVDDILRRVEDRQAAAPPPRPTSSGSKWLPRLLACAVPVLLLATLGNILAFFPQDVRPDPADQDSLRFELFLVAQEIHEYREVTGILPMSLDELGLEDPDMTYVLINDTFSLTTNDRGMVVTYEPGDPDDSKFAAEFSGLTGRQGS